MAITWVLVANGSAGKILNPGGRNDKIIVEKEFTHEKTALKGRDINTDRPGRAFSRTGTLRHAMDVSEELGDHERRVFAKEIANFLETAHAQNRFNTLVLVVSPNLLGELRKVLHAPVMNVIEHQLDKDLFSQPLTDDELLEKIKNDLDLIKL